MSTYHALQKENFLLGCFLLLFNARSRFINLEFTLSLKLAELIFGITMTLMGNFKATTFLVLIFPRCR